uniref:Uncharacterized protein n=1 Tax=Anguilla anguilla TaxID=7936 RepID=A0A0E9QJP2_ANGAN
MLLYFNLFFSPPWCICCGGFFKFLFQFQFLFFYIYI